MRLTLFRSLLLLPALLLVTTPVAAQKKKAARSAAELKAIAAIKKSGGSVMEIAQNDKRLEVAFHLADGKVTDKHLAPLSALKDIVHLNLRGTDVTDAGAVDAMATALLDRFGRVDVVVINSGVAGPSGQLWDLDLADWEQTFAVNVTGVFLVCRALFPHMVERGSGGAANNAYAAISKFFNWCLSRDLIEISPCVGIARPTKRNTRDRVLCDDELKTLWPAVQAAGYPFGQIVQLLILTAQRRGEVTSMEWDDIDWEAKLWHIPEERTKNGRPHTVPLSAPALVILKSVPAIHERLLFPARGKTSTYFSGFGRCKERLDKLLNINPWCLHDLRRTAATGMGTRWSR
ncbi:MAG: SDR family oxidoreductase [Planctomycetes bacterium]|nr:SDR family oxidoreductase [Planctomycetota bacterium]